MKVLLRRMGSTVVWVAKLLIRVVLPVQCYNYFAHIRKLLSIREDFIARGPAYCCEVIRAVNGRFPRECPICNYKGYFLGKGMPPRIDAWCPQCRSVEKHRLLWLALTESQPISSHERILHFAPEECFRHKLSRLTSSYVTADRFREDVDIELDIEQLELPNDSIDVAVCNHVLEHVDHRKALRELHRVIAPGGRLFVTIPIVEGWEQTYENASIESSADRELHFGQFDHLRLFGSDFRSDVREAGFVLSEYTAWGEKVARYGLIPGEKIFVCRKSPDSQRLSDGAVEVMFTDCAVSP